MAEIKSFSYEKVIFLIAVYGLFVDAGYAGR